MGRSGGTLDFFEGKFPPEALSKAITCRAYFGVVPRTCLVFVSVVLGFLCVNDKLLKLGINDKLG